MSFQNIINYGTFYYPAYKHYNREVDVVCDRCETHNLQACIGYGANQDLCLVCVNELTRGRPATHIGFPRVPTNPGYHPRPPINPHDYFTD